MNINKSIYRWLIELTLIFTVLISVRLWMQRDIVSGVAPNINNMTIDGKHFDLYENKQRPILIHFWATWCPVCKLEQSNIENISKDMPVITVAMQSGDDEDIRQFMSDENLTFNVISDDSGELSRLYKIRGVPVSFIVNKDNKIEFTEVGYTTELGLKLRLWWAGIK